jgi:hypothetical protein
MRSEGILNSSNSSLISSLCVPKDIHSVVLGQIFFIMLYFSSFVNGCIYYTLWVYFLWLLSVSVTVSGAVIQI